MSTSTDTGITALADARSRAMRNKDPAGLAACYAPGAVQFGLAPPLASSGFASDGVARWMDSWVGPIGYDVTRWTLFVSEDVAFAHSLNHLHGERTGGQRTDLWFRATVGFARTGGHWLITHEHQSVPFAMDGSDKALLDLTPGVDPCS